MKLDVVPEAQNKFVDSYVYRPFPWMSSSDINSYGFCCHSEFVNLFIRNYEEFEQDTRRMDFGTNGHIVFCNFYDKIDPERLALLPIELESPVDDSRVFSYFLSVLYDIVNEMDKDALSYRQWKQVLYNFAFLRTVDYRQFVIECGRASPELIKVHFIPQRIEFYMEDKDLQYHGKLDAQFITPTPQNGVVFKITDWKTGNPPSDLRKGLNKIPTKNLRQVNGYAYLFAKMFGLPDTKTIEVSVEFLGGEKPAAGCKKSHASSINHLIANVEELRKKIYEYLYGVKSKDEVFPKKVSIYTCKNCSIRESCLSQEEYLVVFGDGENTDSGQGVDEEVGNNEVYSRKVSPRYEGTA